MRLPEKRGLFPDHVLGQNADKAVIGGIGQAARHRPDLLGIVKRGIQRIIRHFAEHVVINGDPLFGILFLSGFLGHGIQLRIADAEVIQVSRGGKAHGSMVRILAQIQAGDAEREIPLLKIVAETVGIAHIDFCGDADRGQILLDDFRSALEFAFSAEDGRNGQAVGVARFGKKLSGLFGIVFIVGGSSV